MVVLTSTMRVMILCHGRNHSFSRQNPWNDLCGTSGLTRQTLYRTPYKTLDINRTARPHIHHDITRPMYLNSRFDIVTAMHAPWFIYFHWRSCDIIPTTFINIQTMLKNGGHMVMCIADEGIYKFMKKYKLCSARVRRAFFRYMYHDVPMRRGQYRFVRMYVSKFISNYVSYCFPSLQGICEEDKQVLLQRWNHSDRPFHDDHQLIVMKYVAL